MARKKSFVLRIDEGTFAALEKWAADDFRSVNSQIEWLLSRALKEVGREKISKALAEEEIQDAVEDTQDKNEEDVL